MFSHTPCRTARSPSEIGGPWDDIVNLFLNPIRVTHFSTDIFPEKDRHEAWANRDWPAIGPLFDATPIGAFHNRSDRFALGEIAVHVSDMGAQEYHRSAGRARRDGMDALIVEILLSGETAGDAAGRSLANAPGCMMFDDLAQEHSHVTSDTHTLLLAVPRVLAERNRIDVAALHGRRVSSAAASLLQSHVLSVYKLLPQLDTAQSQKLGQIAIDLIGVALDIDGLREPVARSEARDTAMMVAARRLVEAHLHTSRLTVGWMCGQLGVSRSGLYRMFEDIGGIQTYIRDCRLERVRTILAEPGNADRIADLAERWGFSDPAHLSRAFRQRFGMAPSDYRALHTR